MKNGQIIVRLSGGLGNQLFQFCAAQYIKSRNALDGYSICLKSSFLAGYETPRNLEVGFVADFFEDVVYDEKTSFLSTLVARTRIARLTQRRIFGVELVRSAERVHALEKVLVSCFGDVLLDGYFQDPSLMFSVSEKNTIRDGLLNSRSHLIRGVKNGKPSVGVHIRRGDYVSSISASSVFCVTPMEYYRSALKNFSSEYQIFVFSDDRSLSHDFSQEINGVDVSAFGLSLSDEFSLFVSCDSFVISNSTFSWWAAILGCVQGHVFAPKKWYCDSIRDKNNPLILPWFKLL